MCVRLDTHRARRLVAQGIISILYNTSATAINHPYNIALNIGDIVELVAVKPQCNQLAIAAIAIINAIAIPTISFL